MIAKVKNDSGKNTINGNIINGFDISEQNKFPDKDTFSIKIGNRVYTDKKEAGTALIDMCRSAKQPNMAVTIGEYQGFKNECFF